jgi:hypothetical protein
LLLAFAKEKGVQVTFFVDAGMLCCMQRVSAVNSNIGRMLDKVRKHIRRIVSEGHEIGLHVHPHWEETTWKNDAWKFAGTRYQLRDYSDGEIAEIVRSYTRILNELADGGVRSYRAGGFCVEPFGRIRNCLLENGIFIDSSVVPGAAIIDGDKGYDFRAVPDRGWWRFSESPTVPDPGGDFVEIAVTPLELPFYYYWGRLASRVAKREKSDVIGDGMAKSIGSVEILRRLAGGGRISELSIDEHKAAQLMSRPIRAQDRQFWQVMGHPKLLGPSSLTMLAGFMKQMNIQNSMTVSTLAAAVATDEAFDGGFGRSMMR